MLLVLRLCACVCVMKYIFIFLYVFVTEHLSCGQLHNAYAFSKLVAAAAEEKARQASLNRALTGKQQVENAARCAAESMRLSDKCGVSCASAQLLRGHRGGNSPDCSFIGDALAKAVFGWQNRVHVGRMATFVIHVIGASCDKCHVRHGVGMQSEWNFWVKGTEYRFTMER